MDKKEIIQEVKKRINPEDIKFLLWCGTWIGENTDLLIVSKGKTRVRLCEPSKLKLDILMIDNSEFIRRLKLLDPAITGPLITGFVLLGNKEEIGSLRSDTILSLSGLKKVPEQTIQFLRAEACRRLQNANTLLQKGDDSSLCPSLVEISLACGYNAFEKYYNDSPRFLPITFDHLLAVDGCVVLKEVLGALQFVKSGGKVNRYRTISLLQKTRELLGVVN